MNRLLYVKVVGALVLTAVGGQAIGLAAQNPKASDGTVVYDTQLRDGWENWSWAKTEAGVTIPGTQRKPIKVDAGPWQAMALHHAPIDVHPYKELSMLVHGQGKGQKLRILLMSDSKVANGDGYFVTINANGWLQVGVPLKGIVAKIDQIQIQNASDQPLPTFYVTEIALR